MDRLFCRFVILRPIARLYQFFFVDLQNRRANLLFMLQPEAICMM